MLIGVTAADAEESLKLTDEQKKKLAAAREEYQKALSEGPGGATSTPSSNHGLRQVQAFEKVLADIATPELKPRMAQLTLQSEAAGDLFAVLMREDVAKKLSLTKEQTDKLAALNRDALELHQLASFMSVACRLSRRTTSASGCVMPRTND